MPSDMPSAALAWLVGVVVVLCAHTMLFAQMLAQARQRYSTEGCTNATMHHYRRAADLIYISTAGVLSLSSDLYCEYMSCLTMLAQQFRHRKSELRPPCCLLCFKRGFVAASHNMPHSGLKLLTADVKLLSTSGKTPQAISAACIVWPILCTTSNNGRCEQLFSVCEKYATKRVIYPLLRQLHLYIRDGVQVTRCDLLTQWLIFVAWKECATTYVHDSRSHYSMMYQLHAWLLHTVLNVEAAVHRPDIHIFVSVSQLPSVHEYSKLNRSQQVLSYKYLHSDVRTFSRSTLAMPHYVQVTVGPVHFAVVPCAPLAAVMQERARRSNSSWERLPDHGEFTIPKPSQLRLLPALSNSTQINIGYLELNLAGCYATGKRIPIRATNVMQLLVPGQSLSLLNKGWVHIDDMSQYGHFASSNQLQRTRITSFNHRLFLAEVWQEVVFGKDDQYILLMSQCHPRGGNLRYGFELGSTPMPADNAWCSVKPLLLASRNMAIDEYNEVISELRSACKLIFSLYLNALLKTPATRSSNTDAVTVCPPPSATQLV